MAQTKTFNMTNAELLAAISVQAGTASDMAYGLIQTSIDHGGALPKENFNDVTTIKHRMAQAMAAAIELESRISKININPDAITKAKCD